ncbi:hypothetical protein ACH5RR_020278 [Cinchona calisaya]|uniref:RING-type E3 ubiquitin transferase n=1 Tax=Cinchona calisaya TaxID=153742 RepID=A0ABD2ZF79_9GENT
MDRLQRHIYIHESQFLVPQIKTQQAPSNQPPLPVSSNGFPILAIAVLGIMATIFLLISYYIFVTKCCFSWQQLDPLRRFSFRRTRQNEDLLMAYSPSLPTRGLDEMLIREIPTFQYNRTDQGNDESSSSSLNKCVVCLNEFQDQDTLRLLPKCSHAFHLDCVDIWLQNNSNCPLCRTSISCNTTRDPFGMIVAPNSSPQDPQPFIRRMVGSDEEFVVIAVNEEGSRSLLQRQQERSDSSRQLVQSSRSQSLRKSEQKKVTKLKPRKFHHSSIMGDECINVREKDDQFFSIQPIRRSFSMDSAVDRNVYLSVQEITRQNRHLSEVRNSEECSSRSQRSIFSLGQGRGSKRAVLPVDQI